MDICFVLTCPFCNFNWVLSGVMTNWQGREPQAHLKPLHQAIGVFLRPRPFALATPTLALLGPSSLVCFSLPQGFPNLFGLPSP